MMASSRPIVHWINSDGGFPVASLNEPGPLTGVGRSLFDRSEHQDARAHAVQLGLEMVIDSETWRNQLPAGHPKRKGLDQAGVLWERFDLGAEAFSEHRVEEIAEQHADALTLARSQWLSNPVHDIDDTVPLGLNRRNEIAIAHASARVSRSRGETAPADEAPRRVISVIGVRFKNLSARSASELIAAYREVDSDVDVIRVWNFTRSAGQFEAVRSLARRMEATTGRPCIVDGVGPLLLGFLRNRVAGGFANRGRLDPRPVVREASEKDDFNRSVDPWAPQILGPLARGKARDQARHMLFASLLCPCPAEHTGRAPGGHHDCLVHNFHWELRELGLALASAPESVITEFGPRVRKAASYRRRLPGLGPLPTAWTASLEVYRRAQQGGTLSAEAS